MAAVSIDMTADGDPTAFVVAMIAIRLLLALAHVPGARARDVFELRVTRASLTAAVLFLVSLFVPEPFRYLLWVAAISVESGVTLAVDRQAGQRARRERDFKALIPRDPGEALDAHRFAERFGLFIIISLGEIVVEAGQASAVDQLDAGGWAALVAAMVFAAALWWLYFDAVADISLRVLALSGGSPAAARTIYAVGHMMPTFALLLMAAGVGLLLEHDHAPPIAYWLTSAGLGIYLLGTRVFLGGVAARAHCARCCSWRRSCWVACTTSSARTSTSS